MCESSVAIVAFRLTDVFIPSIFLDIQMGSTLSSHAGTTEYPRVEKE